MSGRYKVIGHSTLLKLFIIELIKYGWNLKEVRKFKVGDDYLKDIVFIDSQFYFRYHKKIGGDISKLITSSKSITLVWKSKGELERDYRYKSIELDSNFRSNEYVNKSFDLEEKDSFNKLLKLFANDK